MLVEGTVSLDDGRHQIECGPGVAFGDARSSGRELPATASAVTDVRTFVIPALAMAWMAQHYPHVASWLQEHPAEIRLAG